MTDQTPAITVQTADGIAVAIPIDALREAIGGDLFERAISQCLADRLSAASAAASAALELADAERPASVKETLTVSSDDVGVGA